MIIVKIRDVMKEKGVRSAELAAAVGVTPQYISKIFNGSNKSISYEHLDKICIALDCNVADLFEFRRY